MRGRWFVAIVVGLVGVLVGLTPGLGADNKDSTHRNSFDKAGETFWVKGDSNIEFKETAHTISDEHARYGTSSESIKIEANPTPGATTAQFVNYYYRTPPAPVTTELLATVYVKSYQPGVQLKARVVFPKERDPKNPDIPLTTLINGDTYSDIKTWKQLSLGDAKTTLRNQLAALTAKVGRQVDDTGAYVDCLVLNVYTGPGTSQVWIDDLSISPVLPQDEKKKKSGADNGKLKNPTITFSGGDILIDLHDDKPERPFFFRGIRHSTLPLAVLEQARFNTLWFPETVKDEIYEEAVRAKFFLVPSLPLPAEDWDDPKAKLLDNATLEKDAELVNTSIRKFAASDAVLMWNLGSGRTTEQLRRVARLSDAVRVADPRKPRAVDLWDGHTAYSSYVDAIGGHRWPLFSSLEMGSYKDWLAQRRALTGSGKLSWTHVQTHLPEWYQALVHGQRDSDQFADPVGPHPEQIRLLTYLAVATGHRGLLYWSDKFLSDACHGQDRLLEISLLNAELELIEPILLNTTEATQWIPTNDPNVFAAVIRGNKEILVLPIYFGTGTQHCPDQMCTNGLIMNVPLVPEGATAWSVTASGLDEVKDIKRLSEGAKIVLNEFDTTAAIIITTDISCNGRIVRLQENTRTRFARWSSYIARRQAWVQYQKTAALHKLLCEAGAPPVQDALSFFKRSQAQMEEASRATDNNQPEAAYLAARRAVRPLRLLMREHWRHAVEQLDVPTASPFAISVYSLPKHWELARYIGGCRAAGPLLNNGTFDLASAADKDGAAIASLPGWIARKHFVDAVVGRATIVNVDAEYVQDPPLPEYNVSPARYEATGRPVPNFASMKACQPRPELGSHVLRLQMVPESKNPKETPKALERSFVAVDSPVVEFAPGAWVRISFWAKVPGTAATADGAMIYDSVGGEPLAVRILSQPEWKKYHLYRQMPTNGKIQVTCAITGLGTLFVDDLQIEPMIPCNAPNYPNTVLPMLNATKPTPKPLPRVEDDRTLPKPRAVDPNTEPLPPPRKLPAEPTSLPLPEMPALPKPITTRR
jgi:hypothetical protein